jgi:pantetheine-phosphate adenylyltransferase
MEEERRLGLFPGTFDPITNGHLQIIRRGCKLFDHLVVAIGRNPEKRELFTVDERLEMIETIVADLAPRVSVDTYSDLTADYAQRMGATAVLRGLRNATDLHFEFQLALTNRVVAEVETVFIMTDDTHAFTSSSLIRQVAAAGDVERLERLLPKVVVDRLKQKKADLGGSIPSQRVDGFTD